MGRVIRERQSLMAMRRRRPEHCRQGSNPARARQAQRGVDGTACCTPRKKALANTILEKLTGPWVRLGDYVVAKDGGEDFAVIDEALPDASGKAGAPKGSKETGMEDLMGDDEEEPDGCSIVDNDGRAVKHCTCRLEH